MTLVTVPQSNPNDEITALAINQGPNAVAAVLNGQVDDANISSLSGTKIAAGTIPAASLDANSNPETRLSESFGNFIASGLIWSISSGFNGAMSTGVAYISGKRLLPAAIALKTFAASQDTYVSVANTGTVSYIAVANNAASPALAANSICLAKVVTGTVAITSIVVTGTTSLGASICPRGAVSPASIDWNILGMVKHIYTSASISQGTPSSSTTPMNTVPSVTANLVSGYSYLITVNSGNVDLGATSAAIIRIRDNTATGAVLSLGRASTAFSSALGSARAEAVYDATSTGPHTFSFTLELGGTGVCNVGEVNVNVTNIGKPQ